MDDVFSKSFYDRIFILKWQLIAMMQRTANRNAAGLCRNLRSDQPKIERLGE